MSDFAARRVMMVDTQVRPSDVTKYPVIGAMLAVPREVYVPPERREVAYLGENLHLSADRVLLEPRTLAKMLDALEIGTDELVLDVGAGLGYSSAVIGRMAQTVIALETGEWAATAAATLAAQGADNVVVVEGDLTAGAPAHAPYDVIVIEGGIVELPLDLVAQLRQGGRIAALFMQGELGIVRIGTKKGDGILWRDAFNAAAPVLPGYTRKREFAL